MKFSERTLQIVKNFSTINQSILFEKGHTLSTISKDPIFAVAEIDEEIPSEFGIFDLSKFLAIISLYENPNLEIHDSYAIIGSERQNTRYMFAARSVLTIPNGKKVSDREYQVQLLIPPATLEKLLKSVAVLQLPHIAVVSEGNEIFLRGLDSEDSSTNVYSDCVTQSYKGPQFKLVFLTDTFKFIPGEYTFEFSLNTMMAYFHNDTVKVKYWIPCNKKFSSAEV